MEHCFNDIAMKRETKQEQREKSIATIILVAILAFAFLSMCGCAPRVQYITKVQHDSIYIHNVKTDSVYVKDSIYIDRSGDTIYKEVWRWRTKEIALHDTTVVCKTDSIPYPVEVVKVVKKTNGFTAGCTAALFLLIAAMVAYFIAKRRNFIK